MMNNVLTLISDPVAVALTLEDTLAAEMAIKEAGGEVGTAVWLTPGIACDLPFNAPLNIADGVRKALSGRPLDVVTQPATERRKKLMVADMESTIIENEMLDELAELRGIGKAIADITARAMAGEKLVDLLKTYPAEITGDHIAVKEAVFPFAKFPGVDIILGPEMKSTGEVMGISSTFGESFRRAIISSGNKIYHDGTVFISVNDPDKLNVIPIARDLQEIGFKIVATSGTARELQRNGIPVDPVFKVGEGRPNILDHIMNNDIQIVINTPLGSQSRFDEESIGRACIQKGIMAITTLSGAEAAVRAIRSRQKIQIKSLQAYHS